MPQNQQPITLSKDAYTQLTNNDVTNITFQTLSGVAEIRFTVGEVAPAATERGFKYPADTGEAQRPLSELVNLSGANRVWAIRRGLTTCIVLVDHA